MERLHGEPRNILDSDTLKTRKPLEINGAHDESQDPISPGYRIYTALSFLHTTERTHPHTRRTAIKQDLELDISYSSSYSNHIRMQVFLFF